jgi:hypothetical protein
MRLAAADREVHAVEDLLPANGHMKIRDFKFFGHSPVSFLFLSAVAPSLRPSNFFDTHNLVGSAPRDSVRVRIRNDNDVFAYSHVVWIEDLVPITVRQPYLNWFERLHVLQMSDGI